MLLDNLRDIKLVLTFSSSRYAQHPTSAVSRAIRSPKSSFISLDTSIHNLPNSIFKPASDQLGHKRT